MRDADLVVVSREPLNAEVRLDRIGDRTPPGTHYVRSHFPLPAPPEELSIGGHVLTPLRLSIDEVRALPSRTLTVTFECAGNGRAFLEPPAPGEQWRLGAVGTAAWTGVPLRALLERARPRDGAVEVLFGGADRGTPADHGREIAYERSLPLADAVADDVLVAYAMEGAPLPPEHGAPLRLVVPCWYGMASVKWLARIDVLDHVFSGFYQRDRYVIDAVPLREIAPRALITQPVDGAELPRAPFVVRGRAWTGRSAIAAVEVSWDRGYGWHRARLDEPIGRDAWRGWSIEVDPGLQQELTLLAYAVTEGGEAQPTVDVRTALGYANNAAQPVRVRIV